MFLFDRAEDGGEVKEKKDKNIVVVSYTISYDSCVCMRIRASELDSKKTTYQK